MQRDTSISCSQCVGFVLLTRRSRIVRDEIREIIMDAFPSFSTPMLSKQGSFRLLRLLLIFLSALQQLEMPSLLRHEFFGLSNEAGRALMLDLVLLDERSLLRLDYACTGSCLLLSTTVSIACPSGARLERPGAKIDKTEKTHFFGTTGLDFVLIAP